MECQQGFFRGSIGHQKHPRSPADQTKNGRPRPWMIYAVRILYHQGAFRLIDLNFLG